MDILVNNNSDRVLEVRQGLGCTLTLLPGVPNRVDKKLWSAAKKTRFVKKRLGSVLTEGSDHGGPDAETGVEL